MDKDSFASRLVELRMKKGISSRVICMKVNRRNGLGFRNTGKT